jgi:hypothetical protein
MVEAHHVGTLLDVAADLVLVATEAVIADLSPEAWSLRPIEPAVLRGIAEPVRAFIVEPRQPSD